MAAPPPEPRVWPAVVWILVLIAPLSPLPSAAEQARFACTGKTVGRFWPPDATADPAAFRRLTQSGELQSCTRDGWHYRWKSLTVNVHDLKNTRKPQPPGKVRAMFSRASRFTDIP